MAYCRFHATNGSACVFDAVGRDVSRLDRLTLRATKTVESAIGNLDDLEEWAQRRLGVPDRSGRRGAVQPFVRFADAVARAA